MRREFILAVVAILAGVAIGLAVASFREAVHLVRHAIIGVIRFFVVDPQLAVALAPALAGLLVALALWLQPKTNGPRHAEAIGERAALDNIHAHRQALPKLFISVLSIGGGASVGPELPSLEIGARVGALFGHLWRLALDERRYLAGCGAAMGLAALFGQSMAGAALSFQVVLIQPRPFRLAGLLGGCLAAGLTVQFLSGPVVLSPAEIHQPNYWLLPLFFLTGVVAGIAAIVLGRASARLKMQARLSKLPPAMLPIVAGIAVAVASFWLPFQQGSGEPILREMIASGNWPIDSAWTIALSKIVLTSLCLGFGFVGGAISPAMLIGTAVGAGIGGLAESFGFTNHVGAFMACGMAACLATTMRAPIFALLLVWETSGATVLVPATIAALVGSLAVNGFAKGRVRLLRRL